VRTRAHAGATSRAAVAAGLALLVIAVLVAACSADGGREDRSGDGSTSPSKVLFAATFADGLREFPNQIHPERISVVHDPVLGDARHVLKFRVFNSDTGPTENPRAQIETPFDFDEGEDRYMGFAYRFGDEFPTELPRLGWVTLGSIAYGPPNEGAGPLSIRVQNDVDGGGAELRWQRNETYDYDIPWVGPKIADLEGRWVDFVIRTKLHSDPDVGFVELWMNTGSGWERQELHGRSRLYMKTYDSSNDGGANNSRLGLYYRRDIPGPLTVYHGAARIASAGRGAFDAVAPDSYG
jgi:hypothetical protein